MSARKTSADELAKVMEELFGGRGPRSVSIPSTNILLVYGTPADLDDVKKLAIELDERAGQPK